ncbi:MAG: SGNH/GDSL hydrolase family protein [Clostridia bacterium]|nr:SGNH/GDSL hydrolase family protein [Clostridia bacterium]
MASYDLETYIKPIWQGDTVYYETVLFVGEEDCAPLLYPIEQVVGVYNYGLTEEYQLGKDFEIIDGKIKRIKGGKTPYCPVDDYYLDKQAQYAIEIVNNREVAPAGKKYFNFGEKDSYSKYQIAVTYRHSAQNKTLIPQGKSQRFSCFLNKLKEQKSASVIFYGDSITTGCNSSGTPMGGMVEPFAESFPVMVHKKLQKEFDAEIEYANTAVGGWATDRGLDAFDERVLDKEYDLLVLGFGMNDGATPLETYLERTEKMVLKFRERNPQGQVVLLSTTYPNTESNWVRNQPLFINELVKLEKKYSFVGVADMTNMHYNLLETGKRYRDMTGNNVNHPNDFLARIYAQVVLKTLLG